MVKRIFFGFFCISVLSIMSCSYSSYSVNYKPYLAPRKPKPTTYNIPIYPLDYKVPANAKILGKVYIGMNYGFTSSSVTPDDAMYELKKIALDKGADAIKLTRIIKPDYFISSIYRFEANLIIFDFKNWDKIDFTEGKFRQYLDKNYDILNQIEGIWTLTEDNSYKIGIIKDNETNNRDFVAFILETSNPLWKSKQVKIEFFNTVYKKVFTAFYYMGDHSQQRTTTLINEYGLLEMDLKDIYQNQLRVVFIKNYPKNIDIDNNPIFGENELEIMTTGSGCLLSETGLVITNYHIIYGKEEYEVYFPTIDKSFSATIILKDRNNDLALLKINNFNYSELFNNEIPFKIIKSEKIDIGEETFTLGFPLGELLGKEAKLSKGVITSKYGLQDDPILFQIDNPIQPGNSGGPLFNKNGNLIGVIVSSLNAKYFYENASIIPQNVNFAIKSDYLLNLISMLPEYDEINNRKNNLTNKKLVDQIKILKNYAVTIKTK
ncbi:MAG: trypsin-like peptidase domain-containing protein [Candidatus Cloacimonetes bacterium]|nr:trypsin-like peptidase domain-containing protein [Candidatus Cloacimonadota bacterium]MBL7086686.1 trypsin-like peptidase domain-containing protein [Candidatus Cloacimonadota bacterium]